MANMGLIDRILRILVAAGIGYAYFTHRLEGTLGIVLMVVAAAFVLTSFIGFCPLYRLLKVSTRGKA
ncbi:MAG: DUF2892 domain-containing protein [Flavobacteriales bacterium]|nr:DUF2892 domain-containing protein [Flavobacteriales bacterium]MCX7649793.1 DUF2892 domain-containing protein [Flavobacteriales bacterium]MDW8431864.1 DUF2892 domain-containing protein [Flavobacteriales bacterium]